MPNNKLTALLAALFVFAAYPAEAYIGPGAGAGTIAVVLGILASIVMAFFAILWYPAKRLLKKHKLARQGSGAVKSQGAEGLDGP
jgi:hypothetical protein